MIAMDEPWSTMGYRNRNMGKDNDSREPLNSKSLLMSDFDVCHVSQTIQSPSAGSLTIMLAFPYNPMQFNVEVILSHPFPSARKQPTSKSTYHRRPPLPSVAAAPPTPILSSISLCLSCAVTAALSFPFAAFTACTGSGSSASEECSG